MIKTHKKFITFTLVFTFNYLIDLHEHHQVLMHELFSE